MNKFNSAALVKVTSSELIIPSTGAPRLGLLLGVGLALIIAATSLAFSFGAINAPVLIGVAVMLIAGFYLQYTLRTRELTRIDLHKEIVTSYARKKLPLPWQEIIDVILRRDLRKMGRAYMWIVVLRTENEELKIFESDVESWANEVATLVSQNLKKPLILS